MPETEKIEAQFSAISGSGIIRVDFFKPRLGDGYAHWAINDADAVYYKSKSGDLSYVEFVAASPIDDFQFALFGNHWVSFRLTKRSFKIASSMIGSKRGTTSNE